MKFPLLLALCLLGMSASAQQAPTIDETARFLAALPLKGPLEAYTREEAWTKHVAETDRVWARKVRNQLQPIHNWMEGNAPKYHRASGTVFYLFSGPDFLYANTFFPNADTYILCGTEPIGEVPDLTAMPPEVLRHELGALEHSMSSIISYHYFITKEMRVDLARGHLGGTLPILYFFLARLGHTVLETAYITSPAPGVKITFASSSGRKRTLYYFKTDLSNGGGSAAFFRWCAKQGPGLALLKAASYLMHSEGFSTVRNFLLEESRVIVQDDSGIPFRAFAKPWKVRCYGRYVPQGETFGKYYQQDLAAAYAETKPPPLGFAFGYHWKRDRGMLMLGTRE